MMRRGRALGVPVCGSKPPCVMESPKSSRIGLLCVVHTGMGSARLTASIESNPPTHPDTHKHNKTIGNATHRPPLLPRDSMYRCTRRTERERNWERKVPAAKAPVT